MHSPEVLVASIKSPFWHTYKHKDGTKSQRYHNSLIDIWHMEPNGADALTICEKRYKDSNGKWHYNKNWRWHVWHWKISPVLLYRWRRYLFTRCAECGGPSRKGKPVNCSNAGWDGAPKTPLWCGEIKLYHSECLSRVSKQQHAHDPRGCYACSGKEAFAFNRKDRMPRTLPAINPFMPPKQREMLSSLKISMDLGLVTQEAAVKSYFEQKKAVEWQ